MANQQPRDPNFDEDMTNKNGSLSIIQAVREARDAADDARDTRMWKNHQNRDLYLGRQDWSHKQPGQSTEFLPKVGTSVEQMAALVKRGLVQFGNWFSVDVDNNVRGAIAGTNIQTIMEVFLRNMWKQNNKTQDFVSVISDAVKVGMLESLIILKVHGGMMKTRKFIVKKGSVELDEDGTAQRGEDEMEIEEGEEWRLRIDIIRPEDYYPDPTGNGMYEIHRVERDLHEVIEMAEQGIYDMEAVQELINVDYPRPLDEERTDRDRNQDETTNPGYRKRVVLDEFWGTLLHSDGTVAHRNIVTTIANDKYLIRPPEPNPFWHQESPFIAEPIIRVPFSVWHKALYDDASNLNLAINEMFNLILDGGIAAVWGTRQIRLDDLDDPGQVSGGVPQGATLAVKSTLPHGQKVMETITEGNVPSDGMAVFQMLENEFAQAALTNEIKMGQLPTKQIRATEVVEASQSQSVTLDGFVADLETTVIVPTLRKAWYTILQNADRLPPEVFTGAVDRRVALTLLRASPAERFAMFYGMANFQVHGLSDTMSKARDFQKFMAMQQVILTNPWLLQAAMRRFSADKTLDSMFNMMNFNPKQVEKTLDEIDQFDEEVKRTQAAQGMTTQPQGGGAPGGASSTQADANQVANPMSGMTANG